MLIERVIRKLKRDPNYKWESEYTARELLGIGSSRAAQLLRGLLTRMFFRSVKGLLFIGKNVTIKHPYLLSAGENLILDDNVFVNALSYEGIVLGNNVSIARGCTLLCTGVIAQKGQGIIIGNNSGINAHAFLAGQGGIVIGDSVILGPGVKIFSENHNVDHPEITIKDQGTVRKAVTIKNNCWIGANATILAGVTIGEGCVIAAGTVVTRSVPDNSVVAGVPGRVIKQRASYLKPVMAS